MSEWPSGWCNVTLADLGAPGQQTVLTGPFGANLGKEDFLASGVPVFTIGCLAADAINRSKLLFVSPAKARELVTYRLREGDFLFSRMASVGRAGFVPTDLEGALFNYHLMRLRLDDEAVLARFFYYFVRGAEQVRIYLADVSRGATRDGINTKLLLNMPVGLPPLPEQRRIVAKIDSLTDKSRRARDHLDHIPRLVEKYKQAVLAAAFRGDLTREWRVKRALKWRGNRPLREMCSSVTDGDHQAPPKAANGIPFITISAMNDGVINLSKATRYVPEAYLHSLSPTRRALSGDVLYSVTGSYGISALVDFEQPFVFQRHIAILKPDVSVCNSKFVFRMLSSPQVVEQADCVATGTAQKTVPLSGLRNFLVPAPLLDEQAEIVCRLDALFAWIDRLASEATSARKLINHLDQAVFVKAFRGELVPQDPTDEPASALLERIKAARSATPARRGRRRGSN